jgi:CHAT domain-containing protein
MMAAFAFVYAVPMVGRWGVPSPVRELLGIAVVATLALPFAILSGSVGADDYPSVRPLRPAVLAIGCTVSIALAAMIVASSDEPPPLLSPAAWAAVGVAVSLLAVLRYARESEEAVRDRVLTTDEPRDAAKLVARCRAAVAKDDLEPAQGATVAITLAGALVSLSSRAEDSHALTEALVVLDALPATLPPPIAFEAAAKRVDVMRVKAERSGDEVGYDDALEELMAAAKLATPSVPYARGRAYAARAARLMQRASRASAPDQIARLREGAMTELRSALAATPERSHAHAEHSVELARIEGAHPLHGDLDAAIKRCRAALRRLRTAPGSARATAQLVLVELLERRAAVAPDGPIAGLVDELWPGRPRSGLIGKLWPERAQNDLARALLLRMRLASGGARGASARAGLMGVREKLATRTLGRLSPVGQMHSGWMYSQVYAEQQEMSGGAASETARKWAEWATVRDPAHAAEAWWCWITAVSAELRGRVMREKEYRIARIQGLVAEAAYHLAEADRPRDAALALDLGRAVLITERMQRDRAGVEERLLAAGNAELATRWREAADALQRAERAAFESPDEHGETREHRLASAEYLALIEHDRLLREISALPGFEDVDAPPDYDDLRAAAGDGPVVYLAAREQGGFGLVVTAADEPEQIELESLDLALVDQQVERLLSLEEAHEVAPALAKILPQLEKSVVGPLTERLEPGSLVTLVPVGRLGQLPLHAAGVAPDADGTWRDTAGGTVFRYAPNARVLVRARETARELADADLTVLTAAVPHAEGFAPLASATAESDAVMAGAGPARVVQLHDATARDVLDRLDGCQVWHFACHGVHDAASPLESTLQLADGSLTVRAMFARPSAARRLAVLSACQTAMVDRSLVDEVVGFPAALMQAGVAGVVAAQAVVDDAEASLLVVDFFARLRTTCDPARALAQAQAWLRTATNAEIRAAHPSLDPLPGGEADRPCSEPGSWALFSYTGT